MTNMKPLLKGLVKRTPLYTPLRAWVSAKRQRREIIQKQKRELIEWGRQGKPVPPPHIVKQRTIRSFAERFKLNIFVETGTYYGDMVEAVKGNFSQIYS
ncbi:MAG: hypothetical protein ACLQUT_07505, partial [Thermoleophilia bacterium]